MDLATTVIKAVGQAKAALGTLAIPAILLKRNPLVHTPGQATTYNTQSHSIKVVLTSFDQKEIEADREKASDVKIIVFHDQAIPQPNDTITAIGLQFRVMRSQPTYAGSEIAFSTVQGRPLGA